MKSSSVKLLITLLLFGAALPLYSQNWLDRVVAVVGGEAILESDVDNQYNYLLINGEKDRGDLRCLVLEQLLVSKLLYDKAIQDSLEVSDEQVTAELDRRVGMVIRQMGSESEFVRVYGKTIAQFKQDTYDDIKQNLLVEQQREVLMSEAKVTPREVRAFFRSLPKDSLGFLPAEVQVYQIVMVPPFDPESKKQARATLAEIREKIVNEGKDFGLQAIEHSEDPGSGRQGGKLGEVRRGMMVPEFEEVIYRLRPGEVSEVFESEYGYHIAKVHKRVGEVVECSHILKKPARSANADKLVVDSLNRIRNMIIKDSITFERAAIRYSHDRTTRDCGGCVSNPQTGELRMPMDQLDPELYFKLDELKAGEISKPLELKMPDGTRAYHILYLKRKIPPHVPNLDDDYTKIYNAALQTKQAEAFDKWLEQARSNIFIEIKPTECSNALKSWIQ